MVERGRNHYGRHARPTEEAVLASRLPGHNECQACGEVIPAHQLLGGRKRPRCPRCGGAVVRVLHGGDKHH